MACSQEKFDELIGNRQFNSYAELAEALEEFKAATWSSFSIRSSSRSQYPHIHFRRIVFNCDRYRKRKSVSKGLRRVNTRSTDCSARFIVRERDAKLVVTSSCLQHNHPLTQFYYEHLPANRRLSQEQFESLRELFQQVDTKLLKEFIFGLFGKPLTTKDINNIRRKYFPTLSGNGKEINQVLERANKMRIRKSNEPTELCEMDVCETSQLDICDDSHILLQLPDESVCHLYMDGSLYSGPPITQVNSSQRFSDLSHSNASTKLQSPSPSSSASFPSTHTSLTRSMPTR
ncbi:unnamed protein product [Echinostoma caproni]|uniref:FAR1 domain-containing protein n=1 Tax=Echinostoma caproni TaxID=27848 RepID=A0A183AVQ1_9TREM|nr:unnamed protein product [Echinostoma caproni]